MLALAGDRPARVFEPAEDRAFVEFFARDGAVLRSIDRLKSRFRALGSFFTTVGAKIVGLGAISFAPMIRAITTLNDLARQGSISNALGLTAEQFTGIPGQYVKIADTIRGFREIVEGKHDDIPEQAFLLQGTIEQVIERAEQMKREAA